VHCRHSTTIRSQQFACHSHRNPDHCAKVALRTKAHGVVVGPPKQSSHIQAFVISYHYATPWTVLAQWSKIPDYAGRTVAELLTR